MHTDSLTVPPARRPAPAWTRRVGGPLGAGMAATLFFLALLWRDPMLCWNDDYAISILPVLRDVARSWSEGHWPLLSPYCWACGNLAGEYQYGTFSVFVNAVVVFFWKFHWSYPATAAAISGAHVFVMAAGGGQLARGRGLSISLAVMVGLITALNGWMVCWGATNWFGALAALAWLPWAWWALEESLRVAGPWRRWLLPAPFVYLLATGGFPYTVITLGVVTAGLAIRAWVTERRLLAPLPLAVGWVLGLGLAAPAWLMLLEHMHGSARAHGDDLYHNAWVIPWRALPGLVTPSWGSVWPDFAGRPLARPASELAGSLVPLAALAAAAFEGRRRRWPGGLRWDVAFVAVALVLCMVPSAGVFRWSFRWLPFFHIALALAGAEALRWWRDMRYIDPARLIQWWNHPAAWAVGLTGLATLLFPFLSTPFTFLLPIGHPGWMPGAMLGVMAPWLLGAVLLPRFSGVRAWLPAAASVGVLAVAYTLLPTNPRVPRYPFTENLDDPAPLSRERLYLAFTDAPYLQYHGPDIKPGFGAALRLGSTAMFGGLHFINGYSPIRPGGVAQTFKLETHGQIEYPYLEEFLTADVTGHDGLLARLGVDGLVVASDLPFRDGPEARAEWEEVFRSDEGTVYHRHGGPMPDVTTWKSREPGAPEDLATVDLDVRENSRNRVVVSVPASLDRPVLIAFRRPYYPGYRATLDGREIPVGSYRGLLPTVELPAGEVGGKLILVYRPRSLAVGALIAALTVVGMGSIAWVTNRRAARTRE